MISQETVKALKLVCPESREPLRLADADLLAALNASIRSGELCDVSGEPLDKPLEGALIGSDGLRAYPVTDGIPKLIVEAAIDLSPFEEARLQ